MEFTIKIERDNSPESPREDDNLGTMVCWHKRYVLGDEQPNEPPEEWLESLAESLDTSNRLEYWSNRVTEAALQKSADLFQDLYQKAMERVLEQEVIMLPLFLYDHSGITMHTKPFSSPWDSGQVGYIYVTLEDVRKEWSCKRVSAKRRAQVKRMLINEVNTYDTFLRGEVYGYTILDDSDTPVDSCWGFYDLDTLREDVTENLNVALQAAF